MAGNANSGTRKDKIFRGALVKAVESGRIGDLTKLANELVKLALEGETGAIRLNAIKEIADRFDGKVPQAIVGGDEDDPPLKHMVEIDAARSRFLEAIRKSAAAGSTDSGDSEPQPE